MLINVVINKINRVLKNNKPSMIQKVKAEDVINCIDINAKEYNLGLTVTIVIPIYNGGVFLKSLFLSLEENTNKNVKILLIDDNSTDNDVKRIEREYSDKNNWTLFENKTNLGFVKTVNKAMNMVDTDIAIILNTDTIVVNKWVEKMVEPFNHDELIASATPFTNSGVIFSYPNYLNNNELSFPLSIIDKAFNNIKPLNNEFDDVYSGMGFCMAINMKIWKKIGSFDEIHFDKGYGEENDWCFRAIKNGYKHRLVPNLFIWHKHHGSFINENVKVLQKRNQKYLEKTYSNIYKNDIPNFIMSDKWKIYRSAVDILLLKEKNNENNLLITDNYIESECTYGDIVLDLDNKIFIPIFTNKNTNILINDIKEFDYLIRLINIKKAVIDVKKSRDYNEFINILNKNNIKIEVTL